MTKKTLIFIALAVFITGMVFAEGDVSLPKTGQTAMQAAGDDGDLEKGVAWPDPRFTDNGNGTICDNLTGLMWEQAPSGTALTWANALAYANGLSLGGHSDWRLPNVNELESLINAGQADPGAWLNSQGLGVQVGFYWSSTTYAPNTTNAWYVYMVSGYVVGSNKTNNYYVLAVRSGQ